MIVLRCALSRSVDNMKEGKDEAQRTGFLECDEHINNDDDDDDDNLIAEYTVHYEAENINKFAHCDHFSASKSATR